MTTIPNSSTQVTIDECDCTHRQDDHKNGRGACYAAPHGYECRCSRFKRVKGTIDKDFQDWKRAHEAAS